jgi:hypothetical protein
MMSHEMFEVGKRAPRITLTYNVRSDESAAACVLLSSVLFVGQKNDRHNH